MSIYRSLLCTLALSVAPLLQATEMQQVKLVSKAPAGARVYIISPQDGDTLGQTFTVRFGLSGMGVTPAGIDREGTGHHHLLIDLEKLPDLSKPLPSSDNVIHFGGGQTETQVTLPPGKHTLQLVMGNYLHIPHENPVLSEKITVVVE